LDRYLDDFIAGINGQVRRVLDIFRDRGCFAMTCRFDELVETGAVVCSVETYLANHPARRVEHGCLPGLVSAHAGRDHFLVAPRLSNWTGPMGCAECIRNGSGVTRDVDVGRRLLGIAETEPHHVLL